MFLNDLNNVDSNIKYAKLTKQLKNEYDIDVTIYENFSDLDLTKFLSDLSRAKHNIILESEYGTQASNPEYAKIILLSEAIRILLKEIRPKRTKNKKSYKETLDYKVHARTGAAVDHDIGEDEERPDLYWRKHQWEQERSLENHPVTIQDSPPAGEAYVNSSNTMPVYASNLEPIGATEENNQEAGVYVAVMNPNRFLGDTEEQKIMHIEPVTKTGNDTSLLSRKVKPRFIDVDEIQQFQNEFQTEEKNMTDKMIEELGVMLDTSILEEGELQRAEMVFATNDVIMRLTKMIEDLSKIATEDVLGLVDGVRMNFGPAEAEKFSQVCEQSIQTSADGIQDFKEKLEAYREKFEARISDEDSRTPLQVSADGEDLDLVNAPQSPEQGMSVNTPDVSADTGEESLDDLLGDDNEQAAEEPLGRSKKESKVVTIDGRKVRLSEEQILTLWRARLLTETIRHRLNEYSSKCDLNVQNAVSDKQSLIINISGQRVRISEEQLKALVFAKNFNKIVESKGASTVRVSESQAKKLKIAKKITEKVAKILESKKVVGEKVNEDEVDEACGKKHSKKVKK